MDEVWIVNNLLAMLGMLSEIGKCVFQRISDRIEPSWNEENTDIQCFLTGENPFLFKLEEVRKNVIGFLRLAFGHR